MSKKAQGLSINVIIVSIIALIVLVVLVAIFTGRLGIFSEKISEAGQDCSEFKATIEGADVQASWSQNSCESNEREIFTATDADSHPGEHCCIRK